MPSEFVATDPPDRTVAVYARVREEPEDDEDDDDKEDQGDEEDDGNSDGYSE